MKLKGKIAKTVAVGVFALSLSACNAPTMEVHNKVYKDYGLINQDQNKDPNIIYGPNWRNIVLAVVFFEMIIPPIYVVGFHYMKPIGVK